ncbi:MAG: C39 family peptidase, partial [Pseudomonadales bacterium]
AATIIAPSYSMLGQPDYAFQFTLSTPQGDYPLPVVPSSERLADPSDKQISTAIDCFHTLKKIGPSRLIVTCHSPLAPERYLLAVSVRPTELAPPLGDCFAEVRTKLPPSHSQMLENPRISAGICSPVSTAMVLGLHKPAVSVGSIISACYDPVTRMYGMWPLAIRSASSVDCLGAVELFRNWEPVNACLERGVPVVASIRYRKGELPGAPLAATGGHLVVVHGLHDHRVLVNDPAAPNHGSVGRNYPVDAFAAAWFQHRGAAYVLAP